MDDATPGTGGNRAAAGSGAAGQASGAAAHASVAAGNASGTAGHEHDATGHEYDATAHVPGTAARPSGGPRDDGDSPAATLGGLLGAEGLGLRAVVPGPPETPVAAAHSCDLPDPAPWLPRGCALLTTGLGFAPEGPGRSRAETLVASLARAGVPALMWGLGPVYDRVPPALVRACEAHRLPLLTVAPGVPFQRIEAHIAERWASARIHRHVRAERATRGLLEAMSADDPVAAVVHRLGSLGRGSAMLYEEGGRLVESTGAGPTRLVWTEWQRHNGPGTFEVGRWTVLARPAVLNGQGYVLALAGISAGPVHEAGPQLLDTALRILGAISGITRFAAASLRHENAELLLALADGIDVAREPRTWERMRPFGFEPYQRLRSVAAVCADGNALGGAAATRLVDAASGLGVPLLFAESGRGPAARPGFRAVAADGPRLGDWLEAAAGEGLAVGVSDPWEALAAAPQTLRTAHTAADIARAGMDDGGPAVVRVEDVDPASWLLARRDPGPDTDRLDRYAAPLAARPDLLGTVVAHLAEDLDVNATAARLFVHPNTIRYRLQKAGELLGEPVGSAAAVANLYLALHAEIARARRGGRGGPASGA